MSDIRTEVWNGHPIRFFAQMQIDKGEYWVSAICDADGREKAITRELRDYYASKTLEDAMRAYGVPIGYTRHELAQAKLDEALHAIRVAKHHLERAGEAYLLADLDEAVYLVSSVRGGVERLISESEMVRS